MGGAGSVRGVPGGQTSGAQEKDIMDALEAIRTRRSIRQYKKTRVKKELLEQILEAGMMAPSSGNGQPWQFLVLRDRKILEQIGKQFLYAAAAGQAPAAILICGEPELERYEGFWEQDCAAATQNMLLAAHALGLGSVWIGLDPRPQRLIDIRSVIEIPDHLVPFALLPVGYSAKTPPPKEAADLRRAHFDQW
jgi:nitroreductase